MTLIIVKYLAVLSVCPCFCNRRLHLFNGPDMMALPGVKPLVDFVLGVSTRPGSILTRPPLCTLATRAAYTLLHTQHCSCVSPTD